MPGSSEGQRYGALGGVGFQGLGFRVSGCRV